MIKCQYCQVVNTKGSRCEACGAPLEHLATPQLSPSCESKLSDAQVIEILSTPEVREALAIEQLLSKIEPFGDGETLVAGLDLLYPGDKP